jgi:hypothetical protein
MTTFSSANNGPRPAPKVIELPPSAFADDWDNRPSEPMRVGLRLIAEGDIERARASALVRAQETIAEGGQDRVDAFNDAIMRLVIARATCMPDDVREPFFNLPEEDVQAALTTDAVKLLWHEYDVLKVESCTYLPEADEDDLVDLSVALLDQDAWGALTVEKSKRLRRIARHMLEELDQEFSE